MSRYNLSFSTEALYSTHSSPFMPPKKKADKQVTFADADANSTDPLQDSQPRRRKATRTWKAASSTTVANNGKEPQVVPSRKRTTTKTTRKTRQKDADRVADPPEHPQPLDQTNDDNLFFNPQTPVHVIPNKHSLRQSLRTPQTPRRNPSPVTPQRNQSPVTPLPRAQGCWPQPVSTVDNDGVETDIEAGLDLLSFISTPRRQVAGSSHQTPHRKTAGSSRQTPWHQASAPRQPATPRSNIRLHPSDVASPVFTTPRSGPHAINQKKTPTKKKKRHADDVWPFYEDLGRSGHRCKLCIARNASERETAVYSTNTASGILRRHLFTCHVEDWVDLCDQEGVDITAQEAQAAAAEYRAGAGASPSEHVPRLAFSAEAFVDAICAFIAADSQSINIIENPQLRAIFMMLRSGLRDSDIPHRDKIWSRIMQLWEDQLVHLKEDLLAALGRISTTMDLWTDPNLVPYMCVTAHWIQGKKAPGSDKFALMLRRHDGEHIARAYLYVLDRVGITEKLADDSAADYDPNAEFSNRDIIAIVRTLVRKICASHLRRKHFSDCLHAEKMKDYQLIRDVDIRWGPTALMIDRARLLKPAIKRFLAHLEFKELRRYYLTEIDWATLDRYSEILAHVLSGEKTPTLCFVLPAFEAMIEKWRALWDTIPQFSDAIDAGIEKLLGYIDRLNESNVYTLAMNMVADARQLFRDKLADYYIDLNANDQSTAPAAPISAPTPSRSTLWNPSWADELLGFAPLKDPSTSARKKATLQQEIDVYLSGELEDARGLDLIKWWEGSSVPSERVFSSAGEDTTKRHSRMRHELMEALQMLKFSLKRGTPINFTFGMKAEEEIDRLLVLLAEKDEALEDKNVCLQDILSMLDSKDLLEENLSDAKDE
ncbi:hypothetical protein D9758_017382 [Tetrapyrgos nigripes]|uniref:BED-type domain-containing protein n=1 Tax=Tetrapyrgos nigripes TaxID=182062 RepID=A0A8H5C629_9AGAR|nr:hypothetical protein D9758_017382 [Tetrapyrgos nigripes]